MEWVAAIGRQSLFRRSTQEGVSPITNPATECSVANLWTQLPRDAPRRDLIGEHQGTLALPARGKRNPTRRAKSRPAAWGNGYARQLQ